MKRVPILTIVLLLLAVALRAQQFSNPIRLNTEESAVAIRNPVMTIDRKGIINVTWIKKRNLVENGPILFVRSTDQGATFSTPVLVNADSSAVCDHQQSPEFVIDSKGIIHIVWSATRMNTQFDIWYSRSYDNGTTWTFPISICDANDSSIYYQDYPSIAIDSSDNIYVSFLDARTTQRKKTSTMQLFVTHSTDGGDTWSDNIRADAFAEPNVGTCESARQKIAVTKDGNVTIAFRSNVHASRDIYLARSFDGAKTFVEPLRVQNDFWILTNCPFTGPSISLDRFGGAHISWFDSRDDDHGHGHSYYAFIPAGSNETPPNIIIDQPALANPYTSVVSEFSYPNFRAIVYQTSADGLRYQLYANDTLLINDTMLVQGKQQQNVNISFGPDGSRYFVWQDAKRSNSFSDVYFMRETTPIAIDAVASELTSKDISIWPQPASSSVTVKLPIDNLRDLYLRDLLGNDVHPPYTTIQDDRYRIDVSALPSGTYYILTRTNYSTVIPAQKLIIAK